MPFQSFAYSSVLLVIASFFTSTLQAADFSDNFDDGNIAGWSTYNPLGNFSVSFPQLGKVQLQSGSSPNLASFGPGRGAVYRNDLPQTGDHVVSADFSLYDQSNQFFGVVARMNQVGPGTLDAYVLSYSPQWFTNAPRARFALDRLDNEVRTELFAFRLNELDISDIYNLSLTLQGDLLSGVLININYPLNPISTIYATDTNFSSGLTGLFVAGSLVNNSTTLVNFDNFSVQAIPEPTTWVALSIACGMVLVTKRNKTRKEEMYI